MTLPMPTTTQREKVLALTKAAKQNQSDAGKQFGRGKAPIAFVKNDKTETPVNVRKSISKMFGVSEGYLHLAEKVKGFCDETRHPQIWEQIRAGTLTLPAADRRCASIACEIVLAQKAVSK